MKKYLWWSLIAAVVVAIGAFILGRFVWPNKTELAVLPAPELA